MSQGAAWFLEKGYTCLELDIGTPSSLDSSTAERMMKHYETGEYLYNLLELGQRELDLPPIVRHVRLLARVSLEVERRERLDVLELRLDVLQRRDLVVVDLPGAVINIPHNGKYVRHSPRTPQD